MELNAIAFSYKNGPQIIGDMTAEIEPGKMTTIIGPNGSGKSTLLGLMARNLLPASGSIIIDGRDIAAFKPKELARRLAVVHQHNDAPVDLTVERLVEYGRLPYRSMFAQDSEADQEAIAWALDCTKLTAFRDRRLIELSGGQRQRAWIAMALAQRTSILLLDEPTTYLDIFHQIELLDLIRTLNKEHGITIVTVLHDVNQAVRYSDHLKVMKDGKLFAQGTPEEIMDGKLMEEVYGVQAAIRSDDETGLYIIPLSTI